MDIYLVRHPSVDVPPGYTYGQTDVSLRETFEEEASIVKSNLCGLSFDKVWTSPLSRCVKLATYCGYPDAEKDNRLKEINFGDWEMKPWEEISKDKHSKTWFKDWIHTRTPNGECLKDQYERVCSFIDEIRKRSYKNICIFAHGGILTCARVYVGEYSLKEAFNNVPPYGSIIKLTPY